MKTNKTFFLILTFVVIFSFTGCYTQVATSDTSSVPDYEQSSEVTNYYSDDDGESGYYSELEADTINDDGTTIINNYYYGYPYRSYFVDYYPTISIGIGFVWGWSYWAYYPYWPYYTSWCGYGWYYPYPYYYCYYPGYYYYDPYYYPYYGYGGYPSYYGYKTRSEYVSGIRNNSGGRNYGDRTRDPIVSVRDGSIDRYRDDLSNGKDLTVSRTGTGDRTLGLENKSRNLTREVVGLKNVDRTLDTKRNEITSNDINRKSDIINDKTPGERNSNTIKTDKQFGLDRDVSTNKTLGINKRNDVSTETVKRNNNDITNKINKNNRISNETKKLFGNDNSRTNTKTKQPNIKSGSNNNQTPKKDNNTRSYNPTKQNSNNPPKSYSPPKSNNNTPRGYSPPSGNNNTPRSYSPPSGNNTPRSYSPPSGNSGNRGSNNSGSRR